MVTYRKMIDNEVLSRAEEHLKNVFSSLSQSSMQSFGSNNWSRSRCSEHKSDGRQSKLSISGSGFIAPNNSLSNTDQTSETSISDNHVSYLFQKVEALREKANLMMDRIVKIPDTAMNDDENLISEIEILREMEKINVELMNFSKLVHEKRRSIANPNQLRSKLNRIAGGSIAKRSTTPVEVCLSMCTSENSFMLPTKLKYQYYETNVSSSIESIENPKEVSDRRSASESNSCETSNKNYKKYNYNKQNHRVNRKRAETNLNNGGSFDFGNCQSQSSMSQGCGIDNIKRENEFLFQKYKQLQYKVKVMKIKSKIYKKLSRKIYKMCLHQESERRTEMMEFNDRLVQIKKILHTSFTLPPFPETIEVFKGICLFLLENLQYTEDQFADINPIPKYSSLLRDVSNELKTRMESTSIANEGSQTSERKIVITNGNEALLRELQEKLWQRQQNY